MSKRYNKTPSELLHIDDEYCAYCLDEAVAEFIYRLENEQKPKNQEVKVSKEGNPGLKLLLEE